MSDPTDHPFALCLTHDVDRVYKTYQTVYYAIRERNPSHLRALCPGENPYWQFENLMALEDDLGVRSAFYVLSEQHLFRDRPVSDWVRPVNWKRYLGRYTLDDPAVADAVRTLDDGGWEIGLHGSFESYLDPDRLRTEKDALEAVVGHEILGGRQHYLNLDVPRTWRYHAEVGLKYDASLGSSTEFGFAHGYDVVRPFEGFVVFPLTLMESTLPDVSTHPERAWAACELLLDEAADHGAVMTVLWHPRLFSEADFPGYKTLYRRLVERALEMDAWVGPPGDYYRALDLSSPSATGAAAE